MGLWTEGRGGKRRGREVRQAGEGRGMSCAYNMRTPNTTGQSIATDSLADLFLTYLPKEAVVMRLPEIKRQRLTERKEETQKKKLREPTYVRRL